MYGGRRELAWRNLVGRREIPLGGPGHRLEAARATDVARNVRLAGLETGIFLQA